jgi:hypothetical protein
VETPPAEFCSIFMEKTGWLAEWLENDSGKPEFMQLHAVAQKFENPQARELWLRALAQECLLSAMLGIIDGENLLSRLPEEVRKIAPFKGLPQSLETFLGQKGFKGAVALFPITGTNGDTSSGLGQVWVFSVATYPKENASPKDADGTQWLKENGYPDLHALVRVDGQDDCRGDSWQLAAALAARAIHENQRQPLLDLACRWLVSGTVTFNRIGRIITGSKGTGSQRQLLLPAACYPEWPVARKPRPTFVETVDSAWAYVRGVGLREGQPSDWPDPAPALHQLVGGSPGVNIATALLFPNTSVTLWKTSDEEHSLLPAKTISAVLRSFDVALAPDQEIPADSAVEAEQALRRVLEPSLLEGSNIVFNITSGNRLMSFAVQSLARRHPNLWLIYKEIGSEDYTAINYEGDYPITSRLPLPKDPHCCKAPHAARALGRPFLPQNRPTVDDWINLIRNG